MKNKILIYILIGIFILLIGTFIFQLGSSSNNIKNLESKQRNSKLEKYRSLDIPEDCRLPDYESDVGEWVEHLSHHKQTWYCLEYYRTSIEELNNNK